jgi:autotransporter-associated beta strand protein
MKLDGVTINSVSNVILSNNSSKNLNLNAATTGVGAVSYSANNTSNNVILIRGSGNIIINGVLGGNSITLNATSSGGLTLTGSNTYTGSTTINAGNLTISGGNAIVNNGTVILANTAGVNFNVNASETIGTLQGGGATGGTVNIAASQTLTVNQTSDQTFAGVIAGSTGALTKIGANTLTLSGANTYTGTTTISAGNLTISGGSAIANTGTVTLVNTAGVGFNVNSSETIASLQGGGSTGGNVTIASAQTLTVAEAGTQTFAGSLQGSGDFTKSGAGTLTLNGTNTNSGAISVTTGTLTFNGSSALSSSVSSLSANSATISLQDGVGRTITISNGGLSLSGSTMVFELGSSTDRLTFTNGGATLSGTNTIQLADLGSFTAGNYTLISAASGLNGGTWSLNSTNAPTGFTYTLSNSSTTLSLVATANSAFYYWKGGNGSTWGTANNWTSDSAGSTLLAGAPSTTADVVFAATGASNLSTTLGADYTVSTVTLNTGGITIGGANTLTANTTSALAIRDTATSGTNVISANLAGTGAGLTKSGAGTLTLSGANTFGGGLILSAGTLNLNSATAPGSGTITISGGTLDNTSGSAVTLSNNNTQSWNGDFTFTGTNTLSLGSGAVALGASCTVTVSGGTLGVGGIISGSGYSLTKAGAGMLTLRGANTYTGGTTLSAGTLNINNASAIGSGSFTISGGTLNNTSGSSVTLSTNNAQTWNGDFAFTGSNDLNLGNGAVTLGASRTVTVNGGILTVGGIISGSSLGLTKAGAGTLILGGANTYTGATTVSGGTLQTSAADRMSDSSAISVSSGATFALGGNETVASISGAGNYSLGAHTLTFGNTSNQTVSGLISGSGALVKNGSGSITLSGSNTFSGGTTLSAGAIRIGHDNALGTGNLSTTASVTIASADSTARTISANYTGITGSAVTVTFGEASGGTGNLIFAGASGPSLGTGTRTFNVLNSTTFQAGLSGGAGGSLTKTGSGTLILAGNNTYTGATTISTGTLQIGNGGATGSLSTSSAITVNGTLAFNRSDALTQGTHFSSAAITGTGSLVQNGTGTLTLNAANTYSGGTTLNTGTLVIGNTAAAGTGTITQSSGSSLLKFDTSGTISNNMSIYNVASNQTMTLSGSITAQNTTYDVASGTTLSINGTISGSGGVTKNGTGTLTLTGNNTFTGNTTINSGTLRAGVANALGDTREVMVNSGGSLLIAASEAIDDAAEIELHGGTMKFDGNVTETLGTFSLSANSSIDMGLGSVWLEFANLPELIVTYDLKILNYTLYTDHLYFASDAFLQNSLSHIRFYSSTDESSFIGSSFIEGLNPFHVRPVPEPETYATAALLLIGLGIYAYRRRQSAKPEMV